MKYNVIYADPPWSYKDKCRAGHRGAQYKYPCMTPEQLKTLPVSSIAADDSVLFMWATGPQLPTALDVMKAWGFAYKTVGFPWVKRCRKSSGWFWGMGNYTRSNAEYCLLGIRGKPKRINKGVHSVIDSPIEEHSKKPDEARRRIELLYGDVPRIELFARQKVEGWDCWGNEVESSVNLMRGIYENP